MSIPLTLTDAARARVKAALEKDTTALGLLLRLEKTGGCGNFEYKVGYVHAEDKELERIEIAPGVALYIPVADGLRLFGMTIDFVTDKVGNAQFVFTNPQETGRCGCGKSVTFER